MMASTLKRHLSLSGIFVSPAEAAAYSPLARPLEPGIIVTPNRPAILLDPGHRSGKIFHLVSDFRWMAPPGSRWEVMELTVKGPYHYDGSSIPRVARVIYDRSELGALAPLFHDPLYQNGGVLTLPVGLVVPFHRFSRGESDSLFLFHMEQDGVPEWKRKTAYAAVRIGGMSSWKKPPQPLGEPI